MNTADIIVLSILVIAMLLAVFGIIKNKKKGNTCCGDCANCIASKNDCKKN